MIYTPGSYTINEIKNKIDAIEFSLTKRTLKIAGGGGG